MMTADISKSRRLAIVLFNLGGPDGQSAVRPFLFNLFSDPAIISAPALIRYPLAALISRIRERSAQANYARMGGGSPLLPETETQAQALEIAINNLMPDKAVKIFISMRHWNPFTIDTARDVANFNPDDIVLIPLYPQYSTTTTGSSLKEWNKTYKGAGRVHALCCYPSLDGLIEAHAQKIRAAWIEEGSQKGLRLLFSAHGLPQKLVDRGDPYQSQIEATARAVASRLTDILPDWELCYQSRVGPMNWIGPSTPESIKKAISENRGVIITPIAFVSEHIETLVELDHDYAVLANDAGCSKYIRVPALGVQKDFIEALASMTMAAANDTRVVAPGSNFICDKNWIKCAMREGICGL